MKVLERFLTPGLIVLVGLALWTQLNGRLDQLEASIADMDRRLARVEGRLSVLASTVDPNSP